MGAVASFPLDYLRKEDAIPAPRRVAVRTFTAGIASCVDLVTFRRSRERTFKYSVRIQPNTFSEVADHFIKVTRPIDWPVDEPDVE